MPDELDATLQLWLIIPPRHVKAAALDVQESFRGLEWIAPVPDSFLHLGASARASEWGTLAPFEITYRCANCFHDAAIIEAHAEAAPFPVPPFLPHMSIGYFRRAGPPGALRDALVPHRDVELGTGLVEDVLLCDVPIAKSRFFEPWRVVDVIRLTG